MTAAIQKLLHFDIIEILGSGGNGTVYRALDTVNNKTVALKTLKNANEVTLGRFKREFLALKKMDNPGIVKVYDGFFEHNPPFFSMEWVKGKTLSDVIEDMENNPMIFNVKDRETFAMRMATQVCDILIYIHSFDEVHRDLKPDNLFITMESGSIMDKFVVKMLDFGLLKPVNEDTHKGAMKKDEDTGGGMIVGTVHYLSPEQAKGTAVDPRSDLYSLGVIIYRTIGLRLPYIAKDVVGYIFKTVFEDPDPIESHTPECSKKGQSLVRDLLAKEPAKRPPSAVVLQRRLKDMLAPPKISAFADIEAADLEFDAGYEGFGSPLLPPPLIGREHAIKELTDVVEQLGERPAQSVVLTGEPGMGRTSVIKEWKSRIQFQNPTFMQVHFSEEVVPSQDPIGLLLDSIIRTMKPEQVKRVFKDVYPFLVGTSRYLGRYFDTKSVGKFDHLSPGRKLQVLAVNFIKLIHKLAEEGPVIIILDDAQNAPERFFGWLTLLWEQMGMQRLMLLLSVSPDPIPSYCKQFKMRLLEAPESSEIVLDSLSDGEVLELIQAMLPIGAELRFSDKLKKLLMERANGNPFYTTELFSRLYEDEQVFINAGALDVKNIDDIDVPLSIHQALLKKVNRLPKETMYLLKNACVFGTSCDYKVLVTCIQWPEESFLGQLMTLLNLGILSEEEEPIHRLHFNAPALQNILYEQIPERERRIYHNNAAKAIEVDLKEGDVVQLEQIAFHYNNSANHVRAVKYAYLAGNSALTTKETDKAIYFYEMSLKMMDRMENKQAQNLVNLKLAEVYLDNGQPSEALEYYNRSLARENLSKMEKLRSLRGRMLSHQAMDQLAEAYVDACSLARMGETCSNRIQAETLIARGKLAWASEADGDTFRADILKACAFYNKIPHWTFLAFFAQVISNRVDEARKQMGDLKKSAFKPELPVNVALAALAYFEGEFKQASTYLDQGKDSSSVTMSANMNPMYMVIHALLTYKIQSTLSPDHSSDEYLGIADRYIDRFGLEKKRDLIQLVKLEHLLMSCNYEKAWEMVQDLAKKSVPLPVSVHDANLFLCLAVRAAWEMKERPPRGWLLKFQKFEPDENTSFLLNTHWTLAKAAEALLPLSSTGASAVQSLRKLGSLLVKLKFKYYYRATLVKEIAILKNIGVGGDQVTQLETLKVQLDATFDAKFSD